MDGMRRRRRGREKPFSSPAYEQTSLFRPTLAPCLPFTFFWTLYSLCVNEVAWATQESEKNARESSRAEVVARESPRWGWVSQTVHTVDWKWQRNCNRNEIESPYCGSFISI